MIGANQQPNFQLENKINLDQTPPISISKEHLALLDKKESLSLSNQETSNRQLNNKLSNSPNLSIKKQKFEKLTKLYETNRLKLEEYKQKERFLQRKKLEQLEIKQKIQKIRQKSEKLQNSQEQQYSHLYRKLKMVKKVNKQELEKDEILIKKLQMDFVQAENSFIHTKNKLQSSLPQLIKLEIDIQKKQNVQQIQQIQTQKQINQKLNLQLKELKQNLSYLEDKIWLEQQKAKQFYTEQMLNQQVFNIQYKIQVMKMTNSATHDYFLQIKTQIQKLQEITYFQSQQQIKILNAECQYLMQKKNSILPQIKKFKDKRKIFKQSYLAQKQKIIQGTKNLRQMQQKLKVENQKYEQFLKELKQLEQKRQRQNGQPQQLLFLKKKNNKIRQQIKKIQFLYEKIKETMDNLAPKALAKDYQKKIKNLKYTNQKMIQLTTQNQLLFQENKQLLKIKGQMQWKNNPLQKQIETQIQKLESQNETMEKQTKVFKKRLSSIQSKLITLQQQQKLQKKKLQQEKQKEEKIQRQNQLKKKEAEAALKRLIERLDRKDDQKIPKSSLYQKKSLILVSEQTINNGLKKCSNKSKKNLSKQEKAQQSKNYLKHSLKLEQISSSTESSLKNSHEEFGQNLETNFHKQQEQQQLQPFIKSYPYFTYFIFLIVFFFIPGGWLMKFG